MLVAALVTLLAALPPVASASGDWLWPVDGEVITDYKNGDDPYAAGQHRGIDIAAPAGAPVVAATPGTVTFAGTVGSAGLTVAVRTADGRFDTSYLHLDSTSVHAGQVVDAGAELGTVGTTGQRSVDAPHLHFGVREAATDHAYRDPLSFLGTPAPPVVPEPPAPVLPPERPEPRREPAPRPAPAPVRVPVPRIVSVPRHAPAPASRPSLRPMPRPAPRPVPSARPAGGPEPARAPAPEKAPEPAPAPEAGPQGSAAPQPGPATLGPAPEAPRAGLPAPVDGGGVDVGWALACLGALLATATLVRPAAVRRLWNRTTSAIGSVRRPSLDRP